MRCLCVIKADMSSLQLALTKRTGQDNSNHWQLRFQVVMSLNRTKLQAKLRWTEKVGLDFVERSVPLTHLQDQLREGPVSIIPLLTSQQVDAPVSH
jgi:hypothetical protein